MAGDLAMLGSVFSIDVRALDELSRHHRRSNLDLLGDHSLAVLRPARYLYARESVQIGELRVLVAPTFLVMVGRDWIPDLAYVRARLDQTLQLADLGAIALLYTAVAKLVEEDAPVLAGLENDLDEIESEPFGGAVTVARRIHELTNQVIACSTRHSRWPASCKDCRL